MTDNNVIEFKSKKVTELELNVAVEGFDISADDAYSFLMILRHIQLVSNDDTIKIEVTPSHILLKFNEIYREDEDDEGIVGLDSVSIERTIMLNFPLELMDVDETEFKIKDENGNNVVRKFCNTLPVLIQALLAPNATDSQ